MATFPLGEAKEDWSIIRALSDAIGHPLPYDSLEQVRERMTEVNPIFASVGDILPGQWEKSGKNGILNSSPFQPVIENFYMTDTISRASVTMAECSATSTEDHIQRSPNNV